MSGLRFSCRECNTAFDVPYRMNARRAAKPKFCSTACRSANLAKRSQSGLNTRFWSHVERGDTGECWPWLGARNRAGYGWFNFLGRPMNASRAAYILTHGKISGGLLVCHKCDNPPCCNPAHLWLGTDADNAKDRDQKGRTRQGEPKLGEQHSQAKLTRAVVLEIVQSSEPDLALGRKYGVSAAAIYNIRHGKAWTHVTGIPSSAA